MIDTLGLPTISFTHSAADHQWPELAKLICTENPHDKQARATAVVNNPALADWFFTYTIQKFVEVCYVGILGPTDYWMRFEWQHHGSPHVHGLAWLPIAPDVENLLSLLLDLVESTKRSLSMLTRSSLLSILLSFLMAVISVMLDHLKLIHMFVIINHILK